MARKFGVTWFWVAVALVAAALFLLPALSGAGEAGTEACRSRKRRRSRRRPPTWDT
jgi:hypothetical protein